MGEKRFTVILVLDSDGEIDLSMSKIYTNRERGAQAIGEMFQKEGRIKFTATMLIVDDSEPLPEMPKVQQLSLLEVDQDGT